MKKRRLFITGIVLLLVWGLLTGCSGKTYGVAYSGQESLYENAREEYKPDVPDHDVKPEGVEDKIMVDAAAQTLGLQKQRYGFYEWEDDALLVQSEFSHVTLWYEDAAEYPELGEVLNQAAAMIKRSMEDEYDNFCASVRESLPWTGEESDTWVSTLDIQVRRADSVAISLLSDSYADYGRIEEFRGMHGANYDSQTGQELKLSDVITDMEPIPALVEQELNSHLWAGDSFAEKAVADYFRNTPEDGISWTLDYNGVTFYFADGDLAEIGSGRQTATIDFARYPELFAEKYMTVPNAYMVELPLDSSFFTDLDGDGDLEEVNVTGYYDSDMGFYTKFGVYTDTDGHYHYEECFADGFLPYYVKTEAGQHYLYLFCEEYEGAFPMYTLNVMDVNGGQFTRVDSMHVGPGYIPTDSFKVPTDPNQFYLDDFESMAQDMMPYTVGATGMPERKAGSGEEHVTSPEGHTVTVSSTEELLESIGPNVGIFLRSGYYNLSEYMEDVWAKEGENWNERHPYVQIRECFDGVEVVIRGVDGLSIYGDNENLTEIVIDPRYGQVMNFEECYNLSLSGLTMGHTEIGECSGNVLNFYDCRNITLSAMDLYGCGVYGIGSYDSTGEMYVYSSTIRDCAYGALEIFDGMGRFEFRNCMLTGSEGYDRYEKSPYSELAFYECVFGDHETSYYMFLEDIYTENCIWSDNYIYPEYGYENNDRVIYDPDTMESIDVDKAFLDGTCWTGYCMVNPESGETVMIPYEEADGTKVWVSLELYADGTGRYENSDEYGHITWDCDEDSLIYITFEDGRNYYMSAYTMADENHVWLLLGLEECFVWMY